MSDVAATTSQIVRDQAPQPSDEDRRAITAFFDRLRAVDQPCDPGAEALIAEVIAAEPRLRYLVTQLAFFQEYALAAAQNRIQELEYQLEQKQGGLFASLFGSRGNPPPQIQPPGAAPGQFRPSQGGFLGGAGGVALGVLGGAVLGAAVMSALTAEPAAAETPAPAPADDYVDDLDSDDDY